GGAVHRHRGIDAHAGGDEVDRRAVVGEVGQRVVFVGPAGGRPAVPARLAVGVGQGGDGDDLVVGGGDEMGGVLVVVAGGDDVGHALRHRLAHGLVEDVAVGRAAVAVVGADAAQAQVGDVDVVVGVVVGAGGGDPLDAAQQLAGGAVGVVVEHLDAVHACPGGDP